MREDGKRDIVVKITIGPEQAETFAAWSLIGAIQTVLLKEHPGRGIHEIDEIGIGFVESSTAWKKSHAGPKTWLVPEYFPRLFIEDILWLQHNVTSLVYVYEKTEDTGT